MTRWCLRCGSIKLVRDNCFQLQIKKVGRQFEVKLLFLVCGELVWVSVGWTGTGSGAPQLTGWLQGDLCCRSSVGFGSPLQFWLWCGKPKCILR